MELKDNFIFLKEYSKYYLYAYVDDNGREFYKECFLKIDIDGIPERKREPENRTTYKHI